MHRNGDGLRHYIDGEDDQGPHGEEDEPLETSRVTTGGHQENDMEAEVERHQLAVDDVGERSATCLQRRRSIGESNTPIKPANVDACVLSFLCNRGNWKTQAHTGRLGVDYAAHSTNLRVSYQLGALGRQRIHVHVTGDWTQE